MPHVAKLKSSDTGLLITDHDTLHHRVMGAVPPPKLAGLNGRSAAFDIWKPYAWEVQRIPARPDRLVGHTLAHVLIGCIMHLLLFIASVV